MSPIFPGMDPYLENPKLWPSVHSRLIVHMADALQGLLGRRYITSVEERVYVEAPPREIAPDVWIREGQPGAPPRHAGAAVSEVQAPAIIHIPAEEVHESYIAILDRDSGQEVVTVLELVSPTNKYAGPGRDSYRAKQAEVLRSRAHLVEIDLLRSGPHVLAVAEWAARKLGPYDYLICVNRARDRREDYEAYALTLRHRLPTVLVPLAGDDPDVRLDLQAVLAQTYEMGRYRDRLNYAAPCLPPLPSDDQAWADEVIRAAGAAG